MSNKKISFSGFDFKDVTSEALISETLIPDWLLEPVITSKFRKFYIYDPQHTYRDHVADKDVTVPRKLLWVSDSMDANRAVWEYISQASVYEQERYTCQNFHHTLHGRDLIIEIHDNI